MEWKLNYAFTKRTNYFFCGTQDAFAKVKADERVDRTKRALSENENKKARSKEWDNWYEKQFKGKEREVKTALKDFEKGNDEDRRSKYCSCGKECVKYLDERRKDGRK